MKIIQYSLGLPPYRRGGLPCYSTDLAMELSANNNVVLLYPGKIPFKLNTKMKFIIQKSIYPFKVIEMQNPLPVSLGLGIDASAPYMAKRNKDAIETFLKELNPDVIHLHTLMGLPIEFLQVAKDLNIKIIYTTHDFYGLCPKMLNDNPKELLKSRKCSLDCMLCKKGPSFEKIRIMQSHLYMQLKDTVLVKKIRQRQKNKISVMPYEKQTNKVSTLEMENRFKLRLYYFQMFKLIDEFHFNSSVSKNYVEQYFPDVKGKIINITHKGLKRTNLEIKDFSNKSINIGYIGPYDEKKGFFQLIDVLKKIRKKNTSFEFHAYGDIVENDIFKKNWAKNHGIISSDEMKYVYNNIDILIMPSLWHETYGFTVLEALSYDDVCLVSQNVGAKDLVHSTCIFKNKEDLEKKLMFFLEDPTKRINQEKKRIIYQHLPVDFSKHVSLIYKELYVN